MFSAQLFMERDIYDERRERDQERDDREKMIERERWARRGILGLGVSREWTKRDLN
jgi:hypothetical protein